MTAFNVQVKPFQELFLNMGVHVFLQLQPMVDAIAPLPLPAS